MAKDYIQFIHSVKKEFGIQLHLYKEAQMKRRLTTLRDKRGFHSFNDYFQSILKDEHIRDEFLDRITINVTEFYRNPKRWEVLKNQILPFLIQKNSSLRIWSAACSSGEEPYTVSLLLEEYFPGVSYHILATDLDQKVLVDAEKGIYRAQDLKDLPKELKKKYFHQRKDLFHIDPSLKKRIHFKQHDLLSDRYPKNLDLIICRNVLIYFTDEAKDLIYQGFSESLAEDGILFVGSTEQIYQPQQYQFKLFETFFYQKINEES